MHGEGNARDGGRAELGGASAPARRAPRAGALVMEQGEIFTARLQRRRGLGAHA